MILLMIIIILLIIFIYPLYKKHKDEQFKKNYMKYKQYMEYQESITNNENTQFENKYEKEEELNYNKYYKPRRYVITLNELKFYNILMEIAKELNLVVFSQVSLYNILEPQKTLDYSTKTTYFNKISSKSIDFVLVDKLNCRIKLCIELDDSTHQQKKRIERDKFINKLFSDLEINLLRYPVYNVYYKETLKRKIIENMKD